MRKHTHQERINACITPLHGSTHHEYTSVILQALHTHNCSIFLYAGTPEQRVHPYSLHLMVPINLI